MNLIHLVEGTLWGGRARYALDICRHFRSRGWEVQAFTRGSAAVDSRFHQAGIPVEHAPLFGVADLSSVWALWRKFQTMPEGESVIHAGSFRTAFLALLARKLASRKDIRIVMTRHKVRRANDSWLFRRIYRNLDAIIFSSNLARDRFLSSWHSRELPFAEDKITIIAESLNLDLPLPVARAEKGPVTAMFHGTILPGKGLETLLDALSLLKDTKLRLKIAGTGHADYVDSLRRRALARGVMDRIDWKKNDDNILEMMADVDFGVLPSWTEEAFGLANLEYMAAGRAQICSSNGAQPEYITDGREGLLVAARNTRMLAEAIRRLATDPSLRESLGARATETFSSKLSWPRFAERLNAVYCHGNQPIPENG